MTFIILKNIIFKYYLRILEKSYSHNIIIIKLFN